MQTPLLDSPSFDGIHIIIAYVLGDMKGNQNFEITVELNVKLCNVINLTNIDINYEKLFIIVTQFIF